MRLPRIPQVDDLALEADGRLFAPVAGDDLPVQDHVREPLVPGPLQRLAQVGGLPGQHGDDLIEVAVGGGPGDAMVAGQRVRGSAVAVPPHAQHGLPKAAQRPAAARRAASSPLVCQQPCGEPDQVPRDVKGGTIDDHVEPSAEDDLWVRPLLLGLDASVRAVRFVRVSARLSPSSGANGPQAPFPRASGAGSVQPRSHLRDRRAAVRACRSACGWGAGAPRGLPSPGGVPGRAPRARRARRRHPLPRPGLPRGRSPRPGG